MIEIIQGIETGEAGIIFQYKTSEEFVPENIFRRFIIERTGCLVRLYHREDGENQEFFFHDVEDAKAFMKWLLY